MPSLLEQVLESKENPTADALLSPTDDRPHKLSDGSVIYDSTIAAINRILSLNPHLHKRATGLASQPYQLYNGHIPIDLEDKRTFLSLLKADWTPKTPFQIVLVEKYVEKYAPTLSRDCVLVTDTLLWDRDQGKLIEVKPGSVHSVS